MRRALLLIAALAALTLSWAAPAAAAQSPWQTAFNGQTAEERALLRCVNRERSKEGVPLLSFSPPLHQAARLHARQMRDHSFFSHTDQQGRGPKERVALYAGPTRFPYVGENIAAGFNTQGACDALVASDGHRRNMVNPYWTRIGTGYVSGPSVYGTYFVQVFSRHTS
jgi:uncharacterized protein YkwD